MDSEKRGKVAAQCKGKAKRITKSARAGLVFPVPMVHTHLRDLMSKKLRVFPSAAIYAAATLEYLSYEILAMAVHVSRNTKAKRVIPRHLQVAIRSDAELDCLFEGVVAGGGILPEGYKSYWPVVGLDLPVASPAKATEPGEADEPTEQAGESEE